MSYITSTRKLNKTTIKPVLKFLNSWGGSIYSMNTRGANYYHFTLDVYNGKNSFTGGHAWGLGGCYEWLKDIDYINGTTADYTKPYDNYAIELATGKVYDLNTKKIVMVLDSGAIDV